MKLTPIQELEGAIRQNPSNAELYLQLAALYAEKDREYEAERLLLKGESATDDPRVRTLREDVTMARLKKSVALARRRAQEDGSAELQSQLADACAEQEKIEREIFTSRCHRDSSDTRAQYELGRRLRRAGKLPEARQQLERALSDAELRPAVAVELGECLRQLNETPEALRHYRLAANSATTPEQLEFKKQALWNAARVAASIKLSRLTQRYLGDLRRIDPHYGEGATQPKE